MNIYSPFVIHSQSDPARGQVQFCYNLIANLFEKGKSPGTEEFREVRTRRQRLYHYIKGNCNMISYYGIFTIEILPSQYNQTPYQIRTGDIDLEFSRYFTIIKEYKKPKFLTCHLNLHKQFLHY